MGERITENKSPISIAILWPHATRAALDSFNYEHKLRRVIHLNAVLEATVPSEVLRRKNIIIVYK